MAKGKAGQHTGCQIKILEGNVSNIAIDSKGKVNTNSVNVRKNAGTSYDRVEPANINDITPLPKILDEIENRLGTLPNCIGCGLS